MNSYHEFCVSRTFYGILLQTAGRKQRRKKKSEELDKHVQHRAEGMASGAKGRSKTGSVNFTHEKCKRRMTGACKYLPVGQLDDKGSPLSNAPALSAQQVEQGWKYWRGVCPSASRTGRQWGGRAALTGTGTGRGCGQRAQHCRDTCPKQAVAHSAKPTGSLLQKQSPPRPHPLHSATYS